MAKLEFNVWDFEIQTIKTGEYTGTKKVNLKWPLATDPTLIQEMEGMGVKEFVKKDKEE